MSAKFPVPNLSAGYRSVQKLMDIFSDIGNLFDNTLSRDGTAPNQMEAPLDMNGNRILNVGAPVADTDAVRKIDLAGLGGGGGGGGSVLWDDVLSKPTEFPPEDHTHSSSEVTDFTTQVKGILGTSLAEGTDIDINYDPVSGVTTITSLAGGGGGGSGQEPVLLSEFGPIDGGGVATTNNNSAIALAEAATDSEIYLPDGVYAKSVVSPTASNLTKHYTGRGIWLEGTTALPADFSYMATKPTTHPTQGLTGWFRGDQRFTDGGEYRVIGPDVRRYDVTSRYFESNTIPHHAWFDVNSGNSGANAFITSGVSAGATVIPLPQAADANWVGKTVAFATTMDGTAVETKTVTAVNTAGNNITVNTPLANTYTWNPGAGLTPCIYFGHRTWAGHGYVKVATGADGGGDVYGHIVRQQHFYQPKPTEYHTFMTGTMGQYGGDQYANTDGTYMTGWESQQWDQGHDVAAIAFVQSFLRDNDTKLDGGRFWGGLQFQSSGSRPVDVGVNLTGNWRNGFDMTNANVYETTRVAVNTLINAPTFTVVSTNGAHIGDPVTIGEPGAIVYTGTISGINTGTKVITVTPNLPGSVINAGTFVSFTRGGAAIQFKNYQRIIWNSSNSTAGRSGDPTGVFTTFYGNQQGDLIMESGTDGSGEFWAVRFARGASTSTPDTSRFRLRPDGVQVYGNFNMTGNFAASGSVSGSQLAMSPGVYFYFDGTSIRATKNFGSTSTIIY